MKIFRFIECLILLTFLQFLYSEMAETKEMFKIVETGIGPGHYEESAWGDYDNDGDYDILVTGTTALYRNDGEGSFTEIPVDIPDLSCSSVSWGDYNNDGFIDILITGVSNDGNVTGIYRNNCDGTFTDIEAGLESVAFGDAEWLDYNNDGRSDIIITGNKRSKNFPLGYEVPVTRIYHNNGDGSFTDIDADLPAVSSSSVSIGDYDNDGDQDILLAGLLDWANYFGSAVLISEVYKNNGDGTFSPLDAGLTGVDDCSVAWGDYDNDGDLDILLNGFSSGFSQAEKTTAVYRNDGNGVFTDIELDIPGVLGKSSWCDLNSDGYPDFIIYGLSTKEDYAALYMNDKAGSFYEAFTDFPFIDNIYPVCGDYNNDGRTDIILNGSGDTVIMEYITPDADQSPPVP